MAPSGEAYAELIKEQLTEERSRKTSLEQRGVFVITSSGTLVTLVFAIAVFSSKGGQLQVPTGAAWILGLVLVIFAGAAVLAILANTPLPYTETSTEWMRLTTRSPRIWEEPSSIGERRAAQARLDTLASARRLNKRKTRLISAALSLEVAAVIGLAVALPLLVLRS